MERDDDIKGTGNSYTTRFRQYDARLGRWLSTDPLAMKFPSSSPYVGMGNNPVVLVDPDGLDTLIYNGSSSESEKIINVISDQFDAKLSYSYSKDSKGNVSGVKIYGVKEAKNGDERYDELRTHLENILNSGNEQININKIKNTPNIIDEIERFGGMMFTVDENGKKSLNIAEQWFSNDWSRPSSSISKPAYLYAVNEPSSTMNSIAWLALDSWTESTTYSLKKSRSITFGEALGHEIIHLSRHKSKTILSKITDEENATITIMNNLRLKLGIPRRPIKEWDSGYFGIGAGMADKIYKYEQED